MHLIVRWTSACEGIRLVAVEAFGDGKALFPTGFVIPKAFGTPNMPDFDCKICLTSRKNDNSPRSKPSTATSLLDFKHKRHKRNGISMTEMPPQ
jgi:hypothetical protein